MKLGEFLSSRLHFHLILLVCKCVQGASSVISKYVISSGIHVLLFNLCSSATGAIVLLLISYFKERHKMPLIGSVLFRLFFAGCGSFIGQISIYYGLKKTSPELATVISCSIPIMASVIAITFRTETLHILRYDGQGKVLGILLACIGAGVMSLYQGPKLLDSPQADWYFGALLILLGSFGIAISVNIQAPLLKKYHAAWTVMAGIILTCAVLSTIACFIVLDKWWLPSAGIFTISICSGLVVSLVLGAEAWVLARTGVLLVACYTSFTPISTTILSIVFLGSHLFMGSIIGTVLVILGVATFGWSEAESKKLDSVPTSIEPLIDNQA